MRIGLIGTGEMGSAVGARLRERGADVVTSLAGRSPRSAERIAQAGVRVVAGDDEVVRGSAFVLSVIPPAEAVGVAEQFAPVLARAASKPFFVDCNAIAPRTMERIAAIVEPTGAGCIDAGIVGSPPRPGTEGARFYTSGPAAAELRQLIAYGLDVRVLEGPVGFASAMKMSYAGITKGITGVAAAMLTTAARHGLGEVLRDELALSQAMQLAWFDRQVPQMWPKAYRWDAEMREIALFAADEPAIAAIYAGLSALYERFAELHADAAAAESAR